MERLLFKKLDAFTKGDSPGNPAGYVSLEEEDSLSKVEMQKLARELKGYVNEVGFLYPVKEDYGLTFFSSECEVDFCGHATIGIMYDLLVHDPILCQKKELSIHVKAGKLSVYNRVKEEDSVYIMAPEPEYFEHSILPQEISVALGTDVSSIAKELPIQLIDGGLRTLIIPISSLEKCLELYPDQEKLRLYCLNHDIDIIHVFVKETYDKRNSYRTRVFAPKFGYLEDPATGSGNSAFGYYLIRNQIWEKDFSIEQGPVLKNANIVKINRKNERILFGGCATIKFEGNYYFE